MLSLDDALELTKNVYKRKNFDVRMYQKSNEYLKFIFPSSSSSVMFDFSPKYFVPFEPTLYTSSSATT